MNTSIPLIFGTVLIEMSLVLKLYIHVPTLICTSFLREIGFLDRKSKVKRIQIIIV